MESPTALLVDLDERAIGANILIDTLEEFLVASPKETHSKEHLLELCEMLRHDISTWTE